MSAAKHTPAPWTRGTSEQGKFCVWIGGATEPDKDMGPDETWIDCGTEANARLIAAAPEQNELLATFAEWARQVAAREDVPRGIRNAAAQLADDGRRLIAKATLGSQS